MNTMPGVARPTFYFNVCGQVNTCGSIKLALTRADEMGINTVLVASETGLSALRVLEEIKARRSSVRLIVTTSALGTAVPGTILGDLSIGIPDQGIYNRLRDGGATVVRATDPLYGIDAGKGHFAGAGGEFRTSLRCISSGAPVCLGCTAMATDAGVLAKGEPVVALAGSFIGLDTALITEGVNAVDLLRRAVIHELICKPRDPRYTWPINFGDWQGDIEPYRRFAGETD